MLVLLVPNYLLHFLNLIAGFSRRPVCNSCREEFGLVWGWRREQISTQWFTCPWSRNHDMEWSGFSVRNTFGSLSHSLKLLGFILVIDIENDECLSFASFNAFSKQYSARTASFLFLLKDVLHAIRYNIFSFIRRLHQWWFLILRLVCCHQLITFKLWIN